MKINLEICSADIESVIAAKEGGADRIELCSSLETGGITPSAALIRGAVEIMGGENVNVLIRPRPGDFIYDGTPDEDMIYEDIRIAMSLGADGIVCGALTPDGNVDKKICEQLRKITEGKTLTFHRAFDQTQKPLEALSDLISLGFDRILTSGWAPNAVKGMENLRLLHEKAGDKITIMAGSGVSENNILDILRFTGVKDVHASAKEKVESLSRFYRAEISMGSDDKDVYGRYQTSARKVAQLRNIIDRYENS